MRRVVFAAFFAASCLCGCLDPPEYNPASDTGDPLDTSNGEPDTTAANDTSSTDTSTADISGSQDTDESSDSGQQTGDTTLADTSSADTDACPPPDGGSESCDGKDNDCDGLIDEDVGCSYTTFLGSARDEHPTGVATAGAGEPVYVVGYTEGNLGGQSNKGKQDAFVAKFDATGQKEWVKTLGTPEMDRANEVVVDPTSGAIYVVGTTRGDLDGESNAGKEDAFLARFKPDGSRAWLKLIGSAETDTGLEVDIAPKFDRVFVAGETDGALGDGATQIKDGAYAASFDRSGNSNWIHPLDGIVQFGGLVAQRDKGTLYLNGSYYIYKDLPKTPGCLSTILLHLSAQGTVQSEIPKHQEFATYSTRHLGILPDQSLQMVTSSYGVARTCNNKRHTTCVCMPDSSSIYFTNFSPKAEEWRFNRLTTQTFSGNSALEQKTSLASRASLSGELSAALDISTVSAEHDIRVKLSKSSLNVQKLGDVGGAGDERNGDIDITPNGSLYLVGSTDAGFDGGRLAGKRDIFLKRLR